MLVADIYHFLKFISQLKDLKLMNNLGVQQSIFNTFAANYIEKSWNYSPTKIIK